MMDRIKCYEIKGKPMFKLNHEYNVSMKGLSFEFEAIGMIDLFSPDWQGCGFMQI